MAIQPNENRELEPRDLVCFHEIRTEYVLAIISRDAGRKEGASYWVEFVREERDFELDYLGDDNPQVRRRSIFLEEMVDVSKLAEASYLWLLDNTDFVPASAIPKFGMIRWSTGQPLAHEVQVGNVLASVVVEFHGFKVILNRGELLGEQTRLTTSFRPEDLPHVAQAAMNCHGWWHEDRGPYYEEKGEL